MLGAGSRWHTQTCLRCRTGISSATPRALLRAESWHLAHERFCLSYARRLDERNGDAALVRRARDPGSTALVLCRGNVGRLVPGQPLRNEASSDGRPSRLAAWRSKE